MAFDAAHEAILNNYLTKGIHEVGGWCIPNLWQAIAPLGRLIGEGPVAEIGVFEGKFLIGLIKTFDPDHQHRHTAIDVFDLQQFNLDRAGVGKADVLDANLQTQGLAAARVEKVRADSLSLRQSDAEALMARSGKIKFFSVDGCHDVAHTVNDIEFAMQVTDHAGVIAIDDYLNPDWPGVGEAVAKMYLLREFPFVPLLYICNKLLLCSLSFQASYLEHIARHIKAHHPTTAIKQVTRFGFTTLSVKPKPNVRASIAFGEAPEARSALRPRRPGAAVR